MEDQQNDTPTSESETPSPSTPVYNTTPSSTPTSQKKSSVGSMFMVVLLACCLVMAFILWQWISERYGGGQSPLSSLFSNTSVSSETVSSPQTAQVEISSNNELLLRLQVAEEGIWQLKEWQERTQNADNSENIAQQQQNEFDGALFLLRTADYRYWLGADNQQIIPLLEEAHRNLARSARPQYLPLMQKITDDINNLGNSGKYSDTEIYQQLETLKQKVKDIPLVESREYRQKNRSENNSKLPLEENIANKLGSLIRIRYHEKSIEPVLDDLSHQQYKLLIETAITHAQHAVLNKKPVVYALALQSAVQNIDALTASSPSSVPAIRKQLIAAVDLPAAQQRQPLSSIEFILQMQSVAETSDKVIIENNSSDDATTQEQTKPAGDTP